MRDELKLNSVNKAYKKSKALVNQDINATFYSGEIVALTGHNGTGKTTLLNQIVGVTKPTSGSITFAGCSFTEQPSISRSFVSMMPQLHAPLNGVTMRQSIESILRIRGLNKSDASQHANDIMQELKIIEWSDTVGEKLSGGLQRLTSFAMSVAAAPPIILLDEPTNDVDPIRRQIIWRYLKKIAKNGHIILVVTHNLLEVEQYADRYLLLDKGKLIKDSYIRDSTSIASATNQLSVFVNERLDAETLPEALSCKWIEEELRYEFELTNQQIIDALTWVLTNIAQKKIINYKLSPKSLDETYGEMIHE